MKKIFLILLFFTIFLPINSYASVIISEVAWMGDIEHHSNEWIELYNNGESPVDISGWTLYSSDGSPNIELSGVILAGKTFILERTNDDSEPSIKADIIYTGSLKNTGEDLFLKNRESIVFAIDADNGWPAGDNETKQTMQFLDGGWITAQKTPGHVTSYATTGQNTNELYKDEKKEEQKTQDEIEFKPGPYALVNKEESQINNNLVEDSAKNKPEKAVYENKIEGAENKDEFNFSNTPIDLGNKKVSVKKESPKGDYDDNINNKKTKKGTQSAQLQKAQVIDVITIEKPTHPIIKLLLLPMKFFEFLISLF